MLVHRAIGTEAKVKKSSERRRKEEKNPLFGSGSHLICLYPSRIDDRLGFGFWDTRITQRKMTDIDPTTKKLYLTRHAQAEHKYVSQSSSENQKIDLELIYGSVASDWTSMAAPSLAQFTCLT